MNRPDRQAELAALARRARWLAVACLLSAAVSAGFALYIALRGGQP